MSTYEKPGKITSKKGQGVYMVDVPGGEISVQFPGLDLPRGANVVVTFDDNGKAKSMKPK